MTDSSPSAIEVRIGSVVVEVEVATTRRAYANIEVGSPERCGCSYCHNFVAARGHVYTREVIAALDAYGIPPGKEAEIWQYARLESGLHLYGGLLHFAGRKLRDEGVPDGPEARLLAPEDYDITDRFAVGLSSAPLSFLEPPFEGLPVLQLSFTAHLPWVISDPEPS